MSPELLQELYDAGYDMPHNTEWQSGKCVRCARDWRDISERPCDTNVEELIHALSNMMPWTGEFGLSHRVDGFGRPHAKWIWEAYISKRDDKMGWIAHKARGEVVEEAFARLYLIAVKEGII